MSTDAILTSKKKKLWCDVDRWDRWQDNREYEKGQGSLEGEYGKPAGVSPDEAIEIATYNMQKEEDWTGRKDNYWLELGIRFLKTLDKDDTVILYNDSCGDEYLIVCADAPYADWKEWKDEKDNE
jgi:hypothetical protein